MDFLIRERDSSRVLFFLPSSSFSGSVCLLCFDLGGFPVSRMGRARTILFGCVCLPSGKAIVSGWIRLRLRFRVGTELIYFRFCLSFEGLGVEGERFTN